MKKKALPVLVLMALSLLFFGCSGDENYSTYTNDDHSFRVQLPARTSDVQHRRESISTSAGEIHIDYYVFYGPEIIYMIGATPHGIQARDDQTIWTGLKIASRRITDEGELIDESSFRMNEHPSLLVSYRKKQNNEDFWGKVLLTDIEGVQYQVHVAAYREEALAQEQAHRFLASFRRTGSEVNADS